MASRHKSMTQFFENSKAAAPFVTKALENLGALRDLGLKWTMTIKCETPETVFVDYYVEADTPDATENSAESTT